MEELFEFLIKNDKVLNIFGDFFRRYADALEILIVTGDFSPEDDKVSRAFATTLEVLLPDLVDWIEWADEDTIKNAIREMMPSGFDGISWFM